MPPPPQELRWMAELQGTKAGNGHAATDASALWFFWGFICVRMFFVYGCIVAQEWTIWINLLLCSNFCCTCLDWKVHRCRCWIPIIFHFPQLTAVTRTAVVLSLTFICTGGYEMASSLTEHEVRLMLHSCSLTCWSQRLFSCIHKLYSDAVFNSHSSIFLVLLFPLPGMNIDAHVQLSCCPRPIFSRASLLPASGFAFCY